jgi:hypothetical protein
MAELELKEQDREGRPATLEMSAAAD